MSRMPTNPESSLSARRMVAEEVLLTRVFGIVTLLPENSLRWKARVGIAITNSVGIRRFRKPDASIVRTHRLVVEVKWNFPLTISVPLDQDVEVSIVPLSLPVCSHVRPDSMKNAGPRLGKS